MKKLKSFMVISAITLSLAGCATSQGPEKQLTQFLNELQSKNYEAAYQGFSDKSKDNYTAANMKYLPIGSGAITIEKVVYTDTFKNKAQVFFKYKGSTEQEADIVKEQGSWKVSSFGPYDNY